MGAKCSSFDQSSCSGGCGALKSCCPDSSGGELQVHCVNDPQKIALKIVLPIALVLVLVIIACTYYFCVRRKQRQQELLDSVASAAQSAGAPYACPNCQQAFLVTTSSSLGTSLVSCPRCNTTLSVSGIAIGTALLPTQGLGGLGLGMGMGGTAGAGGQVIMTASGQPLSGASSSSGDEYVPLSGH